MYCLFRVLPVFAEQRSTEVKNAFLFLKVKFKGVTAQINPICRNAR